jgi:Flp pilus assembly protein TadD
MKCIVFSCICIALCWAPIAKLSAQDADESALDALDASAPKPPMAVQEPAGAAELRDAVRRIAQRPTDSYALTDAGYAAVKLGDYDAAFNFFTKADALQPADGRIKAGLAKAQVRKENPFEALRLFDEAIRLGTNERTIALDRALAFDLLGNFERAQRDYALAATYAAGDELILRRAISSSLAGRYSEADAMLAVMLQKNDPEAWRARALMLAARGDFKEADKIALSFLAPAEARRMDGYFRNLPKLTAAQQAAAMHFGHFPIGSDIGEDSNAVRSMAAATGAKPAAAAKGDARLIPTGEPLGGKGAVKPAKTASKDRGKGPDAGKPDAVIQTANAQQVVNAAAKAKVTTVAATQLPPPEAARPPVRIALPAPAPPVTPAPQTTLTPVPIVASVPISSPAATMPPITAPVIGIIPPEQKPLDVAIQTAPQTPAVDMPIAAKPVQGPPIGPGFDSISAAQVTAEPIVAAPVATPAPEPVPSPAPEKIFDLGALVASIDVPDNEKRPSVMPVDLKKIKSVAPKTDVPATAKTDAAAKPTTIAPRIWVQIATGGDSAGLSSDFRRQAKKTPALFTNQGGWTALWGKTKRLLVGPFADMKAAKKWEADFRKTGGNGFVWQSEKTSQIEKLKGK